MKTITFAIPCYNSAEYMDACIESILPAGKDIEILIVNDGSTKDNTAEKADEWAEKHPDIIKAIHKENGGHGSAVNAGLKQASGMYYKVVDSDDWLDRDALETVMGIVREQAKADQPIDMIVANYVYEKVHENKQIVIRYNNVFPTEKVFGWNEIGSFSPSQYLLMHSVIYRTKLLQDIDLELPHHCFYVDNIFVYVPLPQVKTIYYSNSDLYRYYIGREDQSVNESVMMSRIDQQLRITRIMIDSIDIAKVSEPKLARYLYNYLSMMMCICSIFLRMQNTKESEKKLQDIWSYLKEADETRFRKVRNNILNRGSNLPTELGRRIGIAGYHLAQKIFNFN